MLRYSNSQSKKQLALAGFGFLLSLLSKETGIAFLVILPLTLYFYSPQFKRAIIPISVALVGITGIWLIVRMMVFKDLPYNVITTTSALNNTLYAAPDLLSRYVTS